MEILYIMDACEMFYDPSKSVINTNVTNACECRCESYKCVANKTRMENMQCFPEAAPLRQSRIFSHDGPLEMHWRAIVGALPN